LMLSTLTWLSSGNLVVCTSLQAEGTVVRCRFAAATKSVQWAIGLSDRKMS
jgi:hypothetical protein